MDLRNQGGDDGHWTYLAQDSNKFRACVEAVMDMREPKPITYLNFIEFNLLNYINFLTFLNNYM